MGRGVSCVSCETKCCSNYILHVKVPCDVSQRHVMPRIMAETDVSCLCTERERAICFGYGINLPFGTGAARARNRHNNSNVTCKPLPTPCQVPPKSHAPSNSSTGHWEHVTDKIHMENLCQ